MKVFSERIYLDGESFEFSEFFKIDMNDYVCFSVGELVGNFSVLNIFFVDNSSGDAHSELFDQLLNLEREGEIQFNPYELEKSQVQEIPFSSLEVEHENKVYKAEYFEYVEYTDVWAGEESWDVNNLSAPEYGYFMTLKDTDIWRNKDCHTILRKFIRDHSIFSNILPEHELTDIDYDGTYHILQRKIDLSEDMNIPKEEKEYWSTSYPLGRLNFNDESEFHHK